MATTAATGAARRCRECGAAVPPGHAICPHCRSADLFDDPSARATDLAGYEQFQRRRRLAVLATATTTLALMGAALGLGLAYQDVEPGFMRGGSGEGGLMPILRAAFFLLVINPLVIGGVGLVLGLFSYRLWYRLLTGERATTDISVLETLGGRAPARREDYLTAGETKRPSGNVGRSR